MNKQFKKIFSVLFAILIGAGIIFFAWRSGSGVEVEAPTSINTEWKNSLSVVPQKYNSKILGATRGAIDLSSAAATTTTDIVARKLLVEYVAFQKGTATSTISDTDAQAIANNLVQEVRLPQKKEYRLGDLTISSDNSREANILYAKTVNALTNDLLSVQEKETDLTILATAVNSWNATTLTKLQPKVVKYQKLIKDLLAVRTPSDVAPIHLRLIQSLETLRSATVGLQSVVTDPVAGIASINEYRSWIEHITLVRQEYRIFYANY